MAVNISNVVAATAAAAIYLLLSGPAWADRIDGNWCFKDGRHLIIDGPNIRTPGGAKMTGEYDRHAFRYIAPKGERYAGVAISMIVLSDEIMNLQVGDDAAVQVWTRCSLEMS